MVAAAAEDDNAEGRGGVDSSVGLKVVCRCCCFISTTTFTLKSGESICCAALRRLSKGSIFYRCRCLQDMSALGKCSFYVHTKALKDTLQHNTYLPLAATLLCHTIALYKNITHHDFVTSAKLIFAFMRIRPR